jgi:hypothetical protein
MTVGKYENRTKADAPTTREQLRALMHSHVEMAANTPPPPTATAVAVPVVQRTPTISKEAVPAPIESRQSLRLIPSELSKINTIINLTLEQTGERATVTDVLRIGLKRLGESFHITREEIKLLRAADGRRHKAKG